MTDTPGTPVDGLGLFGLSLDSTNFNIMCDECDDVCVAPESWWGASSDQPMCVDDPCGFGQMLENDHEFTGLLHEGGVLPSFPEGDVLSRFRSETLDGLSSIYSVAPQEYASDSSEQYAISAADVDYGTSEQHAIISAADVNYGASEQDAISAANEGVLQRTGIEVPTEVPVYNTEFVNTLPYMQGPVHAMMPSAPVTPTTPRTPRTPKKSRTKSIKQASLTALTHAVMRVFEQWSPPSANETNTNKYFENTIQAVVAMIQAKFYASADFEFRVDVGVEIENHILNSSAGPSHMEATSAEPEKKILKHLVQSVWGGSVPPDANISVAYSQIVCMVSALLLLHHHATGYVELVQRTQQAFERVLKVPIHKFIHAYNLMTMETQKLDFDDM